MKGRSVGLIAVVAAALALPGRADAVDHVVLFVSPTSLSASNALSAWKLSAAVVGATSPQARETFGVTLTRSFLSKRAEELHAFRAAPARTVTFDGQAGRWEARFGSRLAIAMTITATGPPQPLAESQGCRGALAKVPVSLRGSFVLRTGTAFFGTIRRVRLSGLVTFNPGGPLDCAAPPTDSCSPSTTLTAVKQGSTATLRLSPDSGGWTTLSFADRRADDGSTWYHVMRVEQLGFNPLAGEIPTIGVRLPAALPVRGSGTFTAQQSSTETRGACSRVAAAGALDATFRTRFAGWGARTLRFTSADQAQYAVDS